MLIRLRQDMDAQFQGISRKRGLFALYHSLADRLFAAGGGGWPKRSHHTVAQRWNNVVGSYKVRQCFVVLACPGHVTPGCGGWNPTGVAGVACVPIRHQTKNVSLRE
jgi:hypothetical protein